MSDWHRGREPEPNLSRLDVDSPPGWTIRRHGQRHWWLYRHQEVVAEIGVLSNGEWWVCPDGEALPWATSYRTPNDAVRALTGWWEYTQPFE